MKKEIVVEFDAEAYKEYKKLQEFVANQKKGKTKPSYSQLFSSINNALCNIKADHLFGNFNPQKVYLEKNNNKIWY